MLFFPQTVSSKQAQITPTVRLYHLRPTQHVAKSKYSLYRFANLKIHRKMSVLITIKGLILSENKKKNSEKI